MIKIIFLIVFGVVAIAYFNNFGSQAEMTDILESVALSAGVASNLGELDEIRKLVDDFMKLRNISDPEQAEAMAADLDERINNLNLVKQYCEEEISTLELLKYRNPYERLQELCPPLKDLSLTKAAQLYGHI